ncbi:MAG: hypothetical protein M9888_03155 [Chitinophagales bacterium]|nr:hypothetical protein [Chitinophagales bacterium]
MNIQILLEKNLSHHALNLIEKIKTIAYQSEDFNSILALITIEEIIQKQIKIEDCLNQELIKLNKEYELNIQLLQQENELNKLLLHTKNIFYKTKNKQIDPLDINEIILNISKNKNLQEPNALTQKGRLSAYSILIYLALLNKDINELVTYLKAKDKILEESKMQSITTFKEEYLSNTNNFIITLYNSENTEEAQKYLLKFEQANHENHYLKEYHKYIRTNIQIINLLINSKKTVSSQELIEIEKSILELAPINFEINKTSLYYLSILFYCIGAKEKSIFWLQQMTLGCPVKHNEFLIYTQLIVAYIYYEQNYPTLVKSTLNSIIYYVKKEEIHSQFLHKMISISNTFLLSEDDDALYKAYNKMNDLYNNYIEKVALFYNDFSLLIWFKSKINNTSYMQELQKDECHFCQNIERYWDFIL